MHNLSAERLGYPTQKPLALLERVIAASSNPGDVVLDPFCGCGTAVVAAQKLNRQWIGIDVTHLAISLMKNRLTDMFGETLKFAVRGTPEDVGSARMLAETDRYEFQYWANSLVNAQPIEGREKKGADRGIDGVIRFVDDEKERLKRVIVQVKSGHVQRNTMGELRGTIEREKAEMGMLISLEPPTKPMRQEAVAAGTYYSPGWNREYPRVQIWTIEELLAGAEPKVPPMRATFERAQRLRSVSQHRQSGLFGD
jgi:site-specific DNA-methyltransferase (adenine-specific)